MRSSSLVSLAVVCIGCTGSIPRPPAGVHIALRANVAVQGQARVEVPGPPPPPPAPVAIVGAPVVEFFGIPLEDAADVVFVLDCSGSMDGAASGRLAQLAIAAPPPPPPPPVVDPPDIGPTGLPPAIIPGQQLPEPPPPPPAPTYDPSAPAQPPPVAAAPSAPPVTTKIEIAKAELIDALQRLPAGTFTNVIFFNSGLEAMAPDLIALGPNARADMISFVADRTPAGSTALTPAMRAALLMNTRRIVLLSDGRGNVGGSDAVLLRDVREAVRGGVRIDTIGLGGDQDVRLLRTLAADSGGIYQRL
ncbi:MAG: hypothetical protein R3B06_08075 [Kofleriaceae bacterium]